LESIASGKTGLGTCDAVLERCGVKLLENAYRSKFFVHTINRLNAIIEESDGRVYRAEDLTTKADIVGEFILEITRDKGASTKEWLESAVQMRRMNTYSKSSQERPLFDWEVDVVRKVVDPRAWEQYERIGYARPDFL
jgi:hypothetical protein